MSIQSALKHLLLLDNHLEKSEITDEILNKAGFLLSYNKNNNIDLNQIKKQVPNIILINLHSHTENIDVCKNLRLISELKNTPIIIFIEPDSATQVKEIFDVGATHFLLKPLTGNALLQQIHFFLTTHQNKLDLKSSSLQLSTAHSLANMGSWFWHTDKNTFQLSPQLLSIFNISDKIQPESIDDYLSLIHTEDQQLVKKTIELIVSEQKQRPIEYRVKSSDNHYLTVLQDLTIEDSLSGKKVTATVQNISEEKENKTLIHQLAYYDALTGLASRRYFQKHINHIITSAERNKQQFAFLSINIDGFKAVNDQYGHEIGDLFLKSIARRLKIVIRDLDFAARLDGNEFCIVAENMTEQYNAATVAERCLTEFNKPFIIHDHYLQPLVSIGIALYPRDGKDKLILMKAADMALASAKKAKKHSYAYYTEEMTRNAIKRLHEEKLLKNALKENQLVLHYQPQVSIQTGKIMGFESLIRWQHPEKGLVYPSEFIGLAEKLGLIIDIGKWVINTACQQIMDWHKQGYPLLQIAVNISPIHFQDSSLIGTVNDVLKQTNIPVDKLELEITESVMQTEGTLDNFHILKNIGIKLALDDFGTGFSSLSSLKHLPIDCLKIDKIFIDDIETAPDTSILLGVIIGLAKSLKHSLVAEGVETLGQALIVKGMGCDVIQGYYFSRPLDAKQIPEIINKDFSLNISI